jgi:hypothetical protein
MAQCTAHSSRTGEQCRAPAIRGGTVCVTHGGAAPQVKAKALERIQAAAVDVAAELVRLAIHADSESVRVQAAKDILDRAGLKPTQLIEQEITHHQVDDFAETVRRLEAELAGRGGSRSAVAADPPAPPDRT